MKTAQTPVTEASIGDTGYRSERQLWHRWSGTASGRKSGQRAVESPSTGIMSSAMRVPRTGLQMLVVVLTSHLTLSFGVNCSALQPNTLCLFWSHSHAELHNRGIFLQFSFIDCRSRILHRHSAAAKSIAVPPQQAIHSHTLTELQVPKKPII